MHTYTYRQRLDNKNTLFASSKKKHMYWLAATAQRPSARCRLLMVAQLPPLAGPWAHWALMGLRSPMGPCGPVRVHGFIWPHRARTGSEPQANRLEPRRFKEVQPQKRFTGTVTYRQRCRSSMLFEQSSASYTVGLSYLCTDSAPGLTRGALPASVLCSLYSTLVIVHTHTTKSIEISSKVLIWNPRGPSWDKHPLLNNMPFL